MDEHKPIPANSPAFEYVYVANQRCDCGDCFAVVSQELCNTPGGPIDRVTGRCKGCGAERSFDFDIHSFFGDFEKYDRFRQTDQHFRAAMAHVRERRLEEAETALRQVVDPEEGEPAFAWGHYHLAQVLFMSGRPEKALEHLQRAAAIQPLEADIYTGLAHACRALGRAAEYDEFLCRAETLREKSGG
ncbi:MAG: tetratricopeptide repeat protein [Anaerolineae bacterium]|nr:tetratricopeptide repeat protein [Anaerolineae bacterium]